MILPYPPVGRSRIRVKAYVVVLDERAEHHAVVRATAAAHPTFHRPLGAGVRRGERSADAVARAIAHELGATLAEPELLGVLENIFSREDESGHEVVFVYAGRLLGPAPEAGAARLEWRPVAGLTDVPLLPQGLQELLDAWLSRPSAR